jgi:hypothetical protein
MRPFGIELADEGIEAVLLLQAVEAWRTGCLLLEGEMHARIAQRTASASAAILISRGLTLERSLSFASRAFHRNPGRS